MDIEEELRISKHQPTVGMSNTPIGDIFARWIKEYGVNNIQFICSLAYNLGKVQGKREIRRK